MDSKTTFTDSFFFFYLTLCLSQTFFLHFHILFAWNTQTFYIHYIYRAFSRYRTRRAYIVQVLGHEFLWNIKFVWPLNVPFFILSRLSPCPLLFRHSYRDAIFCWFVFFLPQISSIRQRWWTEYAHFYNSWIFYTRKFAQMLLTPELNFSFKLLQMRQFSKKRAKLKKIFIAPCELS